MLALVSLLPSRQLPEIPDWSSLFSPDKVAHFGAYAIFALLLSVEFHPRGGLRGACLAFLIAALFGALMEVLQGVSGTGRSADLIDIAANCIGALIGCLLFLFIHQLYKWAFPPGRA
ncbi:VanZ family protein [Lewinella sp. 4G2]|uniref:VanZ family protein n=1 Tax=Lewinella sp. 4G2 TaxID=1803372 RepID=UPI0007B4AE77|nr:VanZ family protein [Lewinella sp. 4G2]OAV42998.1 hypothetical protein A3850_000105 [Lewinella sp. 4G2]